MIPYVFGMVCDAAILGVILIAIAGEFPGWGPTIGCVFVVGLVTNLVGYLLPWPASLLGVLAGGAAGAGMIRWLTECDPRRALKAAAVYVGLRLVVALVLFQLLR